VVSENALLAFAQRTNALRFIIPSLAGGVLFMTGVFAFLREDSPTSWSMSPLTWVAALLMVQAVLAALFLGPRAQKSAAQSILRAGGHDPLNLAPSYVTGGIVGAALLEGVALLAALAYFMDGSLIALSIAIALALLIPVLFYPTTSRVRHWYEDCEEMIRRQSR
jgi:hypothetical protein